MSDILCITNRNLCKVDFLTRIEEIAACHPAGIILREKDLSPKEYEKLAANVLKICNKYGVTCVLHTFVSAAVKLNVKNIHMPLDALINMSPDEKRSFTCTGASCHSAEDAFAAQSLGCTYITAGHIFETDCKKGLPGRGLEFLNAVCEKTALPVYAIGGINSENINIIRSSKAAGACIMSGFMQCSDVKKYFEKLKV